MYIDRGPKHLLEKNERVIAPPLPRSEPVTLPKVGRGWECGTIPQVKKRLRPYIVPRNPIYILFVITGRKLLKRYRPVYRPVYFLV